MPPDKESPMDSIDLEREKGITIMLADFGIAKYDAKSDITATGLLVGTPQYMARSKIAS